MPRQGALDYAQAAAGGVCPECACQHRTVGRPRFAQCIHGICHRRLASNLRQQRERNAPRADEERRDIVRVETLTQDRRRVRHADEAQDRQDVRRIGLQEAAGWVLRLCRGYRLPEPARLADRLSKSRLLDAPASADGLPKV